MTPRHNSALHMMRRVSARLHLSARQRLNLQLEHSPVAVLGVDQGVR